MGFKSLTAHGHADALSFMLRAFGVDVFVDPGTYDYFSFPARRDYFRAHNTVVVDDADQSVMFGPFLRGPRARARCTKWEPRGQGGSVTGEHDGYMRLADPVIHRRTLDLDGESRILTIRDEIATRGSHNMTASFHLAEDCVVSRAGPNRYEIIVGSGVVTLEMDSRLSVQALKGSEKPIGGWISRRYHLRVPSTTLISHGGCQGNAVFVCRIKITAPPLGSSPGQSGG